MGMRIALDTNRYVDFTRGVPEAVEPLRRAERIHLPLIVLAALRASCGARARRSRPTTSGSRPW